MSAKGEPMFKHVLIATDGSPVSNKGCQGRYRAH